MSGSIKRIVIESPFLEVGCVLGEGPVYDPQTSMLHFVDIAERKVFHLDTRNKEISIEQFDEPVTCLALRRSGRGLACAAAQGFGLLEENSKLNYLSKPLLPDEILHTRFNDGACDSKGRFFAGTVYCKERGIPGKLWRYNPEDNSSVVVDHGPFTDSNGLGWSPDEKILYFTDSFANLIYAYDYHDGELSNRRVFVDAIAQGLKEHSYCDGLCVDDAGGVWSSRWGGSQIIRFSAEGRIDVEIFFPSALNITACCFGGPNEDQLYVTTAHCGAIGGDAKRQTDYPDSGHLFLVDLSGRYRGRERYTFAG